MVVWWCGGGVVAADVAAVIVVVVVMVESVSTYHRYTRFCKTREEVLVLNIKRVPPVSR